MRYEHGDKFILVFADGAVNALNYVVRNRLDRRGSGYLYGVNALRGAKDSSHEVRILLDATNRQDYFKILDAIKEVGVHYEVVH